MLFMQNFTINLSIKLHIDNFFLYTVKSAKFIEELIYGLQNKAKITLNK